MPRLTPDGRRAIVWRPGGGLRIVDLERRTSTPLTLDEPQALYASLSPDGAVVIYQSGAGLRRIRSDGSGRSEPISGTSEQDYPSAFSPDGDSLVFTRISTRTSADIYMLSARGDPNPRPLMNTNAYEAGAQFSPDG